MGFTFVVDVIDLSNKDLIVSILVSATIGLLAARQQASKPVHGSRFRRLALTTLLAVLTAIALFYLPVLLLDRLYRITNPGIILDFDDVSFVFYIPPALYVACLIYFSQKRRSDTYLLANEQHGDKCHKLARLNITYMLFAGLIIYTLIMVSSSLPWFKNGNHNTQLIAQKNETDMTNADKEGEDTPDEVAISSPEVISSSSYDIDDDGRKEAIEILLSAGKVINHEEVWCGAGKRWVGEFMIRVSKEGRVLSEFSLNKHMGEGPRQDQELSFWAPKFSLAFRDYNDDGNIDFNLGQYNGCEGNDYWLFTIRKNGTIEPLPLEGSSGGIFIQRPYHINSTDQIDVENKLVRDSYYNRDEEKEYIDWYKWIGDKFVIIKHEEISDKEPFNAFPIKAEQLIGEWDSYAGIEYCDKVILYSNKTFRAGTVTGRWDVKDNRLVWTYDKDYKKFKKGQEDVNIILDFKPGEFRLREGYGSFTTFKRVNNNLRLDSDAR